MARKVRQSYVSLCVAVLALACVCGIALMGAVNREPSGSRYTYTTESDIWFVEDGEMKIEAAMSEAPVATAIATAIPAPVATQVPLPAPAEILDSELVRAGTVQPAAEQTMEPIPVVVVEEPEEAQATKAPEEAVEEVEPVKIMITATGDVTLGTYKTRSGAPSNFKAAVEQMGYDYFFANVRELFSQDDLTIVNLEGPLTSHSSKRPNRTFNFRGYPEWVEILTSGSVEIANMANNHALDYKEEGFKDTYDALMGAGIGASGYGPEYFVEVKGFTVGSIGFTEWNFEEDHILEKVAEARKKCDLLIVSMHWNEEHEYRLSRYCRKMGRALIDAGADIVIGNHSHVYGEIERYKGKYIINSLGNFCFGGNDDPYVQKCAIFRQVFLMYPDGRVEDGGIDIIPAFVSSHAGFNDFQPRIATPEEGREILGAIAGLSPNMNPEEVIWLEDSYVLEHGILTEGPQAVTPSPEPSPIASTDPFSATTMSPDPAVESTDEMAIAQDIPR